MYIRGNKGKMEPTSMSWSPGGQMESPECFPCLWRWGSGGLVVVFAAAGLFLCCLSICSCTRSQGGWRGPWLWGVEFVVALRQSGDPGDKWQYPWAVAPLLPSVCLTRLSPGSPHMGTSRAWNSGKCGLVYPCHHVAEPQDPTLAEFAPVYIVFTCI